MSTRADKLRAQAAAIEAAELKAERMKTAHQIPTCPECGGRSFKIGAWTVVHQSIDFDAGDPDGAWSDDYESGDHTEQSESAECNDCGEDVRRMLERHGWQFYADPEPYREGLHSAVDPAELRPVLDTLAPATQLLAAALQKGKS